MQQGEAATRLARTLEVAAAEQRERRAQRAAAAAQTSTRTMTFEDQMNNLSRGSQALAQRSAKLSEGITQALNDRRAAAVEFERRCSELAAARVQAAAAQSELRAQERKLANAAADVAAALKSDVPAPWVQASPAMFGNRATAAIVCTLRAAPLSSVETFISHHLELGFSHIYLFFDDPNDPALSVAFDAAGSGRVTPIVRNADLEAEQCARCSLYSKLFEAIPTEIMARQQLNCETAAQRALAAGYDWLLHIDVDEAFCLATATASEESSRVEDGGNGTREPREGEISAARTCPVELHFGSIDPSLSHVAYLNHEAVPERVSRDACANYFDENTLFRCNPHCIPGFWKILHRAQQTLQDNATQSVPESGMCAEEVTVAAVGQDHKVEAAVQFWIDRTIRQLGAPSYFLAYVNGKSAVRLCPTQARPPRPSSVHRWEGQPKKCVYFDPAQASLLHFVNCGLSEFRTKYELLAECTTSDWFTALPLYSRARDAAASDKRRRDRQAEADSDESVSEIEAIYRAVVVLEDEEQVKLQLDAGVCVRLRQLNLSL